MPSPKPEPDASVYENPLVARYSSRAMAELWSANTKFSTWRKLWVALAEAERELGLPISEAQVAELRSKVDEIDFAAARAHEKRLRHDVMAHVHAYGDVAPTARPIIHLGATSCYVTDNTDLILLREGLTMVRDGLVGTIDALGTFAEKYRDLPCLGYTHFQPAQLVTVGKRATLWAYELTMDLRDVERRLEDLRFLGVKGTTGTQASFLALFDGDHAKVEALDRKVAEAFGFSEVHTVSGQTYTRKVDAQVVATLSGIAETAHRFGSDLRLLAHEREVEEPFEADQIGSSAMAYKRNPMRAERMCSIARFAMALPAAVGQTAATQWLERTLDDSAVRRLTLPQAFLSVDALLTLYLNVVPGLVVHPAVIARRVADELPFMATENLMMAAVRAGGDRQDVHERIRTHSLAAAARIKQGDGTNDLLERIGQDPAFKDVDLAAVLDARQFVGRSPEQVDAFIRKEIEPVRLRYPERLRQTRDVHV
ncbi:adenylosuccinate lyase [Tundrisphaera sp. TA3]|uniref:adenylosuccinate lyase n=1 Tax=Tundrisphaera sp. TA3 TaxID=3435775 RepID=UPI003EB7BC82